MEVNLDRIPSIRLNGWQAKECWRRNQLYFGKTRDSKCAFDGRRQVSPASLRQRLDIRWVWSAICLRVLFRSWLLRMKLCRRRQTSQRRKNAVLPRTFHSDAALCFGILSDRILVSWAYDASRSTVNIGSGKERSGSDPRTPTVSIPFNASLNTSWQCNCPSPINVCLYKNIRLI